MRSKKLAGVSSSRPFVLMLATAAAVGCASGRGTTTSTSGGEVDQAATAGAAATDTTGRVPPASGGISPTAQPQPLGPGATAAPVPGSPAVATRDSAGGAAGAGGAGAVGGAAGAMSATITLTPRSDADIVALLHESNVGEIQAGTLAQQRATNAAVKRFAQQMVTDHSALDQRGNTLAQQARISPALPDSALPQQQAQEATALQQATGAAFDRAYMAQQVAAHQRTLALVDASIPVASAAALRTMLQSEVRPRVAEHLRTAQELQRQVGTAP